MKILQTNLFLTPRQSYQIVPYKKQENKPDTFVKNTNNLSFTSNDETPNPYQQVLQRPDLVQKVMELVTTAATILVGKAASIGFKKDECEIDVDNICETVTNTQNPNDIYKQEIDKLKEENDSLRKLLAQKEAAQFNQEASDNPFTPDTDIIDVEPIDKTTDAADELNPSEIEPPETESYEFIFPKKRVGVLSKSQKDLKSITTGLSLNQEQGEKLTLICKELLQNGSHQIDDETIDNKQLTSNFVDALIIATPGNRSQIIDEYYIKCGFEPKNEEKIKLPGVVIKGKIDLDSIKDRKRKRNVIAEETGDKKSGYVYTRTEKRPRINKPASANFEEDIDSSQFDIKNEKVSIFRIPGTANKDVTIDLKHLLIKFQKQIEKNTEKPYYQNNQGISVEVKPDEVLKELSQYPYKNINNKNIGEITNSINADPRFHKMFTLHAAMRLIDRFTDFDSDIPIEEQCHNILDSLEHVLKKSFKNGLEVRKYEDKHGYIGARLFISEDTYDDKARKIFGSYPFKLGICEHQPRSDYYDKRLKQPLICTIFANGI